jgi:hypothetical protein
MAYYRSDPELSAAKEIYESEPQTEREKALQYYIDQQQNTIIEYQNRLSEYYDFFSKLSKFLPDNNPILR